LVVGKPTVVHVIIIIIIIIAGKMRLWMGSGSTVSNSI